MIYSLSGFFTLISVNPKIWSKSPSQNKSLGKISARNWFVRPFKLTWAADDNDDIDIYDDDDDDDGNDNGDNSEDDDSNDDDNDWPCNMKKPEPNYMDAFSDWISGCCIAVELTPCNSEDVDSIPG